MKLFTFAPGLLRIGRLELWIGNPPFPMFWGRCPAHCGCFIFQLGPGGLTWLAGDCYKNAST